MVGRAGVALVVPRRFRSDPAYRAFRQRVTAATTYAEVVHLLETRPTYLIAGDFAPPAAWSRRFLNTTSLLLSRPAGDPQRRLAERAVRQVLALLAGVETSHGPKPLPPLSPPDIARIRQSREAWTAAVEAAWPPEDHLRLRRRVEAAAGTRGLAWSAAYQHALTTLLRQRGLRRDRLLDTLVGWELRLSARRVAAARRHTLPEALYA